MIRAAWRLLSREKVLRFLFFSPARSRVYQAVTLAQLEEEEQARFSGEQVQISRRREIVTLRGCSPRVGADPHHPWLILSQTYCHNSLCFRTLRLADHSRRRERFSGSRLPLIVQVGVIRITSLPHEPAPAPRVGSNLPPAGDSVVVTSPGAHLPCPGSMVESEQVNRLTG